MKSQCEGSLHPVEATPGSRFACPWCGKPTPVTKNALLRTHSINGGHLGGPVRRTAPHPRPTGPRVERRTFTIPVHTVLTVRSKYLDRVHYVATTQTDSAALHWVCRTCGRRGQTFASFEGQNLLAKARMNHYQQARRTAKHP